MAVGQDALPFFRSGQSQISASGMNRLVEAVRQNRGQRTKWNPTRFKSRGEQIVGVKSVLIVGYEDIGQNINAAFTAREMDNNGEPVGEEFTVYARTFPIDGKDLQVCLPRVNIGRWIRVESLQFGGSELQTRWYAITDFIDACAG